MRVAKSGSEEGVSVSAKSRASQNYVLKIKARVVEQKEREIGGKGSVESAHLPDFFKVGAYVAHRRHSDR